MDIKNSLAVPAAIVISGIVIAIAIVWSVGKSNTEPVANEPETMGDLEALRPVTANDHVRGDLKAPVMIVEYSDPECPFCKRFHETMQAIVKKYDGKVSWTYRHFPLAELHKKAQKESEATECAAKIGGSGMFWNYTDALYAATPSNDGLAASELPKIASNLGLDVAKFNTCLESGEMAKRVNADRENAMATGGNGTPWSILIGPDGMKHAINGAQPMEEITKLIDLALASK
jgi:protein-disulfide isomerase